MSFGRCQVIKLGQCYKRSWGLINVVSGSANFYVNVASKLLHLTGTHAVSTTNFDII